MSAFSDAIRSWIDPDGLVGSKPNPPLWSTGNGLLETSIFCVMDVAINFWSADRELLKSFSEAIGRCRNQDGSFDKNPGRTDQITHDDLYGIAAASRVCGMSYASLIVMHGEFMDWNLSNTSMPYWDAYAKPWDRAVYLICASRTPSLWERLSLAGAFVVDAWNGDPSSSRLLWVTARAVGGVYRSLDLAISIWRRVMRKKYGTVGGLMSAYYVDQPQHPFVVFGRSLKF